MSNQNIDNIMKTLNNAVNTISAKAPEVTNQIIEVVSKYGSSGKDQIQIKVNENNISTFLREIGEMVYNNKTQAPYKEVAKEVSEQIKKIEKLKKDNTGLEKKIKNRLAKQSNKKSTSGKAGGTKSKKAAAPKKGTPTKGSTPKKRATATRKSSAPSK